MANKCKMVTKCKNRQMAILMEKQTKELLRQLSGEERKNIRCARCGEPIYAGRKGPMQIALVESKLMEGFEILVCADEVYPTETWEDPNFDFEISPLA